MEFLGRAKAAAFPAALVSHDHRGGGRPGVRDAPVAPKPHHGRAEPPTSGIFTRRCWLAACACAWWCTWCCSSAGPAPVRWAVAVIGAVFGVLLSFMAGVVVPDGGAP